jgi:hypothetical protein
MRDRGFKAVRFVSLKADDRADSVLLNVYTQTHDELHLRQYSAPGASEQLAFQKKHHLINHNKMLQKSRSFAIAFGLFRQSCLQISTILHDSMPSPDTYDKLLDSAPLYAGMHYPETGIQHGLATIFPSRKCLHLPHG